MAREITYGDLDRTALAGDCVKFAMDEETFRAFYERNARGLWWYLARITGDRALADDLLQETFFRFLRAAATYDGETHQRNALFRIAANLATDAARRRRARGQAAPVDLDQLASGVSAQSTDVTRALDKMNARERAMLWLAYAEGASHQEIAARLGLRVQSLKPLLSRARKKMAALLGGAQ